MITYNQRAAELFGAEARLHILCTINPDGNPELRDLHVAAAVDHARIAFHFAELVRRSQQLEAPRHSSGPPRPASAPQRSADSG